MGPSLFIGAGGEDVFGDEMANDFAGQTAVTATIGGAADPNAENGFFSLGSSESEGSSSYDGFLSSSSYGSSFDYSYSMDDYMPSYNDISSMGDLSPFDNIDPIGDAAPYYSNDF